MRWSPPLAAAVLALAAAIYFPALDHPFQFDDELFLRDGNVSASRWEAFLYPPVPRALTWMTFLVQRRFGEPDPSFFRAFNIVLHGLNSLLVFLLLRALLSHRAAPATDPNTPRGDPSRRGSATARDLSPTGSPAARDLSPTAFSAERDLSPTGSLLTRDACPSAAPSDSRDLSPPGSRAARDLSPAGSSAARDLSPVVWGAVFGAGVFGLHPVQSEAVILVYQRSVLLAAFFGFLGLLVWMGGAVRGGLGGEGREESGLGWWRTVAVFGCFLAGVASKEFMAVFPLVLWFHDGLLLGRWRPRRSVLAMLFVGAVLAVGHLTWADTPDSGFSLRSSAEYASTEVKVWWRYAFLIFGLAAQNIDHAVEAQTTLWDGAWWGGLLGLVVLAAWAWSFRRRTPKAVFCASLFVLFLLPTSSLLPSPDFMFEHRVYASMLGVAGLAGLGLQNALRLRTALKLSIAIAATLVLVLAGAATVRRGLVWRSPAALWSDAAAKSPEKYRTQFNLGVALTDLDPEAAARRLSKAITIDPGQPLAYRALGELKLRLGDRSAARTFWEQARLLDPSDWRTLTALGKIHLLDRDYGSAAQRLSEAARLAPTEAEPRLQLARLNLLFGFVKDAIQQAQAGLEWNPDSLELNLTLANAVAADLNWPRAEELYRRALEIDPTRVEAHYGLARTLFGLGRREEGLEAARRGLGYASRPDEREFGERLIGTGEGR